MYCLQLCHRLLKDFLGCRALLILRPIHSTQVQRTKENLISLRIWLISALSTPTATTGRWRITPNFWMIWPGGLRSLKISPVKTVALFLKKLFLTCSNASFLSNTWMYGSLPFAKGPSLPKAGCVCSMPDMEPGEIWTILFRYSSMNLASTAQGSRLVQTRGCRDEFSPGKAQFGKDTSTKPTRSSLNVPAAQKFMESRLDLGYR
mmetsp:Transcript_3705/g.7629  ORF Transcript_3705/g.7629 Transcript_3705/m.7629 type:complete len:205 (+) Transcript_3705:1054-1668(+)